MDAITSRDYARSVVWMSSLGQRMEPPGWAVASNEGLCE